MISISENIKVLCKKKIIVPLICTVLSIVILIICPFFNVFHPTFVENIYDIHYSDSYIDVTIDKLYYSGYNLITSGNNNYGYYYALKDDRCQFVIIPIGSNPKSQLTNYRLKGKIIHPNPPYENMLKAFSNDLNWNAEGLSQVCGDFIVSNADYHPYKYAFFFWIMLVILFLSIKNMVSAICGFLNPALYPVCTFLGKSHQQELIDEAQSELDSENYLQINSMYITENYFIDFGSKKISVIPLSDIIWCYRLGSRTFLPKTQKPDYSLHFTIRSGAVIIAKHKTSDEALEAINAIHATEYDIIIGHSDSKRRLARKRIHNNKSNK